jgi:S-adenosylmethionine-diacylglycerol 3-amino-3-carboxypropyl transferase
LGKWERTFAVLAKINRFLLGGNFDRIFTFTTIDEQKKFYHESFPHFRWRLVLFLLGNKALFNALLYKGDFIQKNLPLSHFQYYHSAFERLLTTDLASKSFFLHLCFYGKINSELGNPIEAGQEIYKGLVNSTSNIMYSAEDFLTHLKTGINRYDFLSLSDVPSYFSGGNEAQFMQMIRPGLNPGAIVVNRYYLRQPVCDLSGYLEITDDFKELLALEKVQMYVIKIYQFRP